jgi:hypothetical protein
VSDQTFTALALDAGQEILGSPEECTNEPDGYQRFPSGEHLASFLGLTSSKHISDMTLYRSKRITKQGSPNGRYAAVNVAQYFSQRVPRYQVMCQRIKGRKPPRRQLHCLGRHRPRLCYQCALRHVALPAPLLRGGH